LAERPTPLNVEAYRAKVDEKTRQDAIAALLRSSGVGARHSALPERREHPWWRKHDAMENRLGTGMLVAVLGGNGSGKTQLASSLVLATCERAKRGLYATASELLMELRATFGQRFGMTERDWLDHYTSAALLAIDEYHRRGETAWEDTMLEMLVDRRYREKQDTILISSLDPEEFRECVGRAIWGRLMETGGIVKCDWESFRSAKRIGELLQKGDHCERD
jgi:DNA replication protein DnaC